MNYKLSGDRSGLSNWHNAADVQNMPRSLQIQCLPLYSILAAIKDLGHSTIDLFSLDVEGAEVPILESLPLDKTDVRNFLIETKVPHDKRRSRQKRRTIEDMLGKAGYKTVDTPFHIDVLMTKE